MSPANNRAELDRARFVFGITVAPHTPLYVDSTNRYGIKCNGGWWWIAYLSKEKAEFQADQLAAQLITEYWT